MSEEVVREHRGQGARKAARRKFRHALQNTLLAELLRKRRFTPKAAELLRKRRFTPKAARFIARMKADVAISQGSTDIEAHGRSLLRK